MGFDVGSAVGGTIGGALGGSAGVALGSKFGGGIVHDINHGVRSNLKNTKKFVHKVIGNNRYLNSFIDQSGGMWIDRSVDAADGEKSTPNSSNELKGDARTFIEGTSATASNRKYDQQAGELEQAKVGAAQAAMDAAVAAGKSEAEAQAAGEAAYLRYSQDAAAGNIDKAFSGRGSYYDEVYNANFGAGKASADRNYTDALTSQIQSLADRGQLASSQDSFTRGRLGSDLQDSYRGVVAQAGAAQNQARAQDDTTKSRLLQSVWNPNAASTAGYDAYTQAIRGAANGQWALSGADIQRLQTANQANVAQSQQLGGLMTSASQVVDASPSIKGPSGKSASYTGQQGQGQGGMASAYGGYLQGSPNPGSAPQANNGYGF
jgi:hypothetical protein